MKKIDNEIKIFRTLRHVGHLMRKNMAQKFKESNITASQGMVMGILSHDGEMKISEMSEKMGLSNSTVSGIIDRLERQGLVERVRSKEDRRVVYIKLTDKHEKDFSEKFHHGEEKFRDMLKKATDEEIETIVKGFDTLEKVINRNNE